VKLTGAHSGLSDWESGYKASHPGSTPDAPANISGANHQALAPPHSSIDEVGCELETLDLQPFDLPKIAPPRL
jgi:hypothetical protein